MIKNNKGITLIVLVVTILLFYDKMIKYSNRAKNPFIVSFKV